MCSGIMHKKIWTRVSREFMKRNLVFTKRTSEESCICHALKSQGRQQGSLSDETAKPINNESNLIKRE